MISESCFLIYTIFWTLPEKLPYKNIHRPMFPLDKDMADPEFKVEFIPLSK